MRCCRIVGQPHAAPIIPTAGWRTVNWDSITVLTDHAKILPRKQDGAMGKYRSSGHLVPRHGRFPQQGRRAGANRRKRVARTAVFDHRRTTLRAARRQDTEKTKTPRRAGAFPMLFNRWTLQN